MMVQAVCKWSYRNLTQINEGQIYFLEASLVMKATLEDAPGRALFVGVNPYKLKYLSFRTILSLTLKI